MEQEAEGDIRAGAIAESTYFLKQNLEILIQKCCISESGMPLVRYVEYMNFDLFYCGIDTSLTPPSNRD